MKCAERLELEVEMGKRFSEEREYNKKELTHYRDESHAEHVRLWGCYSEMNNRLYNLENGVYYGLEKMRPPRKKKIRKKPKTEQTMIEIPSIIGKDPVRIYSDKATGLVMGILLIGGSLVTLVILAVRYGLA